MISTAPITLDDWHHRGHAFAYGAHQVFFRKDGATRSETPLLVIHGFPTCSWDWAWMWDDLTVRVPVIMPDLLDYGASLNPDKGACSIMDQADMLTALLGELGVQRYHILAHDVGDTVTQELLARALDGKGPDILSVVFLNGGLIPDLHRPRPLQTMLAGPLGPLLARLTSEKKMTAGLADVFGADTKPDAALSHDLWRASIGVNGKGAFARRIRYMKERRLHADRWVGALKNTSVPLHLINGTADPVSGAHAADGFKALVPNAGVTRLEGVGHFPQIEDPAGVLAAFDHFHAALKEAN